MEKLVITPGCLTLDDLQNVYQQPVAVSLHPDCYPAIDAAADTVQQVIRDGRTVYGINTGFGLLARTRIDPAELETRQHSIVMSHAAGVGALLPASVVRLLMVLKINSLARGFSGIRRTVIDALITLVNKEIHPCIPVKGSVGASGDLAPLAHMSAVLLGEGEALYRGERIAAQKALQLAGLEVTTLAPKEGLALLNGTQASTALALAGLFKAENALAAATVTGALSVEAARGSRRPFDPRIHAARGHQAQMDMARAYRRLLSHSAIEESHRDCDKVQDP